MADALLRREIKRLVEEQKVLNQRLQRKPPAATGLRPDAAKGDKGEAQGGNAAEAAGAAAGQQKGGPGGPNYDFAGPEFQIAKRPKVELDPSSEKRSKRLFGFLSSHLNKAKQQLAKEKETDFAQRHRMQEERVNSKLEMARKHIAEIARIQWEEERQKDEDKLAKVSKELIQKENDLMRLHLVQHYANMGHFVGTEAQPTLFWRPAEWDSHTRRLQQQTKVWIETKVKHIQEANYASLAAEAADANAEEQQQQQQQQQEDEESNPASADDKALSDTLSDS
ncbi:pinin/SDK/memA/ domain-containing protein, putative [Eimeria brunetti]|uniref:Pinin/SDK/memA/ domain-containing protein, putative n=1 Tax=Eimeria brunetti TaxID=51314 RepID=U6LAQ9_9EIME|nr:pinin/SDK/memA/ domain-containing protein, putative [Eimeria brunetti]